MLDREGIFLSQPSLPDSRFFAVPGCIGLWEASLVGFRQADRRSDVVKVRFAVDSCCCMGLSHKECLNMATAEEQSPQTLVVEPDLKDLDLRQAQA